MHNAKYVCLKNLTSEHDRYVKKKRTLLEQERRERNRKKALEKEQLFRDLKSKFFGICFTDGLIEIRVLESVDEIMQEGDIMHHCVFSNEYHLMPDSLILSAYIEDKKLETVEVSLSELRVVQSRGLCNENTEYHNRIIQLVSENMPLIQKKLRA